jgi:hypothetical protein
MSQLPWIILSLVLLPCGWFAAAWHYQRRLHATQLQLHAARQTAAEHAQTARWQIGQLQAELAARPPMPPEERERRAAAAMAGEVRDADTGLPRPGSDYAETALLHDGFPQTMMIRPPARR